MNIIVIVFTSRNGIRIHNVMIQDSLCMCWMACYQNRTRVCVDTNSDYYFLFLPGGMLKTGVSIFPPEFCLI